MDQQKEQEILSQGEFAEIEIARLRTLRAHYHEKEKQNTLKDQRRLEFVRWLFVNGKLTDQVA